MHFYMLLRTDKNGEPVVPLRELAPQIGDLPAIRCIRDPVFVSRREALAVKRARGLRDWKLIKLQAMEKETK